MPPTNHAREQALRLSVIFRKVTNGFPSDWGRDLFANVRSMVNTGNLTKGIISGDISHYRPSHNYPT